MTRQPGEALIRALVCVAVAVSGACSDPPDDPDLRPKCLESVDLDCTPLFDPPTFVKIFDNTFHPTCASAGVSCHGENGHQGGLIFEEVVQAEELLLDEDAGPRVEPGDARCSELVVRLDSPGHAWSMPPGDPLSKGERCAIRLWVESQNGAVGRSSWPASLQ